MPEPKRPRGVISVHAPHFAARHPKDIPMDVVDLPLEQIIPYARNPRRNEQAIATVAASIQEFGWRQPIVVDEAMVVLAGHTRLEAARKLGFKTAPVHVAKGLTASQARAFRIMDNRSGENAEWDKVLLNLELADLLEADFDLGLTGFTEDEVNALMSSLDAGTGPQEGEDEIPETPEEPISRPGDLWLLGHHRLLCGDSTVATDVDRLLGPVKPLLMVTDPPYGVEYDPGWRNEAGAAKTKRTGKVLNDDRADWREAWALFPGNIAYVWHADRHASSVQASLEATGLVMRAQIIWAKDRMVLSRGDHHWQHEPCWYAVREGKPGGWAGDRKQTTLWSIPARDDSGHGHSTQKPVECMRRPIVNNSSPGQAVYEPFCGSGTTMIAAEMEGRHAYCMELSEVYCDVIVKRWQAFTGQEATLEGDGRTFEAISDERYDPAKDSAASYDAAIEAKRQRLEAAE